MSQRIKSKEISHIVQTINDLAVLFKDLSTLVVEQGTIMDRIDYNIETARTDVVEGVVYLEKTEKMEKSARARSVVAFLLAGIIVCCVLLMLRHT